jgi:hypothetical protein
LITATVLRECHGAPKEQWWCEALLCYKRRHLWITDLGKIVGRDNSGATVSGVGVEHAFSGVHIKAAKKGEALAAEVSVLVTSAAKAEFTGKCKMHR